MLVQTLVAALLVAGSAAYATWALLPSGARRAAARWLLKLPLPRRVAAHLQQRAAAPNACGCDGCDQAVTKAKAPAAAQPIRFHPRVRP